MGVFLTVLAVLIFACAIHYYFKIKKRPAAAEEAPSDIHRTPDPKNGIPNFRKLLIRGECERVGRDDALEYLKKYLIEEPWNSVAVVSAKGAGGVGKSFLVHIFSEQNRKDHHFLEIYLGPDRPAFDAGVELLDRLNIPSEQVDSYHKLVQALDQIFCRTRGILVLNDVCNESVKILLPRVSNWRVLITTRDRKLAERLVHKIYPLDPFTSRESMALFKKVLGEAFTPQWREEYQSLADYAAGRPYEIRLAAELLKGAPPSCSPGELLKSLKDAEGLSRASHPRENDSRENAPRENDSRENAPRENAPRENAPRENDPRENDPRENDPREND
ncbi:MAG: hypothetical protein GY859_04470, partial [Desulfobacterales bacterium]|nr:hypothetical protein [Desulfobacterales bacterium]